MTEKLLTGMLNLYTTNQSDYTIFPYFETCYLFIKKNQKFIHEPQKLCIPSWLKVFFDWDGKT